VANKFLAVLVGKAVTIVFGHHAHSGELLMFDGYSVLIRDPSDGAQTLIFKGPGMMIEPDQPGDGLDLTWTECAACGSLSATGKKR
jgi:hypothetical protein